MVPSRIVAVSSRTSRVAFWRTALLMSSTSLPRMIETPTALMLVMAISRAAPPKAHLWLPGTIDHT